MLKINPITAQDKLLKYFIDNARCPLCKIDVSRKSLNKHIKQELADDHVYGEELEQKLLELKNEIYKRTN